MSTDESRVETAVMMAYISERFRKNMVARLSQRLKTHLCSQQGCRDGAVVAHPTSNQGDASSIPTHGI